MSAPEDATPKAQEHISLRLDVTPQQAAALTWQMAEHFADGRLPAGASIGFVGTAAGTAAVPVEPVAPTIEAAHAMGASGSPPVEAERLAFEAWVRGHCWALGANWTGSGYIGTAESPGYVCPVAMGTRRMWAAWRDRAALASPQLPELSDEQHRNTAEHPAPAAGEWQPISTAPKDGTNVLLINRKGNMATGLWHGRDALAGWWLRGGNGPNVFFNEHHGPTHWMPLPPAPQGDSNVR